MKKYIIGLFSILAIAAIAQFAVGVRTGPALTIPSGGYKVLHAYYTNPASPSLFTISGSGPVGFWFDAGATNATIAATQQLRFSFQVSHDGTKWSGPNAKMSHPALEVVVTNIASPVLVPLYNKDRPSTDLAFNVLNVTNLPMYRFIRLYAVSNALMAVANEVFLTNANFVQSY